MGLPRRKQTGGLVNPRAKDSWRQEEVFHHNLVRVLDLDRTMHLQRQGLCLPSPPRNRVCFGLRARRRVLKEPPHCYKHQIKAVAQDDICLVLSAKYVTFCISIFIGFSCCQNNIVAFVKMPNCFQ
eukprot:Selendium_serpulae@DN2370_c0_g1_i1.p2